MKIINSSVTVIETNPSLKGIFEAIEKAGRVSYASVGTRYFRVENEPKNQQILEKLKANSEILCKEGPFFDKAFYVSIPHKLLVNYPELLEHTEEKRSDSSYYENVTAEAFVNMIKKNGHLSVLEFGTVYLYLDKRDTNEFLIDKYEHNPYSKINFDDKDNLYITTNMRVIVENNWEEDLKYLCTPCVYHEKRITAEFVCSRSVSHELVRHRSLSFIQQSQRYCAYNAQKFGGSVSFVLPSWLKDSNKPYSKMCIESRLWYRAMIAAENAYMSLLKEGSKPQFAREVLPNSTSTIIDICGFESDWKHFFELRCSQRAHPDIKILADNLLIDFKSLNYAI